jgi:hypothetical protein
LLDVVLQPHTGTLLAATRHKIDDWPIDGGDIPVAVLACLGDHVENGRSRDMAAEDPVRPLREPGGQSCENDQREYHEDDANGGTDRLSYELPHVVTVCRAGTSRTLARDRRRSKQICSRDAGPL